MFRERAIKLAKELYPDNWYHHVGNIELAMYAGSVLNMQGMIEDRYALPIRKEQAN